MNTPEPTNTEGVGRRVIRRTQPRTVVNIYSTDFISAKPMYVYGDFINTRNQNRGDDGTHEAKDRRKYGYCVGCRHQFAEDESIHLAQSVYKNSKCVGNLMTCADCAKRFNEAALDKLDKEQKNAL